MTDLVSALRASLLSERHRRQTILETGDISNLNISRWCVMVSPFSAHASRLCSIRLLSFFQSPIQKKLVDVELLNVKERQWLDAYNAEVLEKVGPLVKDDPRTLAWLRRECTPL